MSVAATVWTFTNIAFILGVLVVLIVVVYVRAAVDRHNLRRLLDRDSLRHGYDLDAPLLGNDPVEAEVTRNMVAHTRGGGGISGR